MRAGGFRERAAPISLAQLEPVSDRDQVQEGDLAVVSYSGTVDGEPFEREEDQVH